MQRHRWGRHQRSRELQQSIRCCRPASDIGEYNLAKTSGEDLTQFQFPFTAIQKLLSL